MGDLRAAEGEGGPVGIRALVAASERPDRAEKEVVEKE